MVDRRGLQKKRPKIEKRKQRDERKEAVLRQKRRIQKKCQGKSKRQYPDSEPCIRGPPAAQWKGLAIHYALWNCKKTEDQRTNMGMNKKQWINGKKGMENMIDYAKEIELYNKI
jgi:hypothetical protein